MGLPNKGTSDQLKIKKEEGKMIESLYEIRDICFKADREDICDSYIDDLYDEMKRQIGYILDFMG